MRNIPKKRLPAIADRAVWQKVTAGPAGIKWDRSVVEKVWKDIGGNKKKILSIEKCGGGKTEAKERIEIRERLAVRNKVKEEEHSRDFREVKRRNRNENVFARPNGRRENAETAISCRGPGPASKECNSSRGEEEERTQMCPCGKAVE